MGCMAGAPPPRLYFFSHRNPLCSPLASLRPPCPPLDMDGIILIPSLKPQRYRGIAILGIFPIPIYYTITIQCIYYMVVYIVVAYSIYYIDILSARRYLDAYCILYVILNSYCYLEGISLSWMPIVYYMLSWTDVICIYYIVILNAYCILYYTDILRIAPQLFDILIAYSILYVILNVIVILNMKRYLELPIVYNRYLEWCIYYSRYLECVYILYWYLEGCPAEFAYSI